MTAFKGLLKYWNATHNYPYTSYELEKRIVEMNFDNDNLESGFLYAARNLDSSYLPQWGKNMVANLEARAKAIKTHLKHKEVNEAKYILSSILPGQLSPMSRRVSGISNKQDL